MPDGQPLTEMLASFVADTPSEAIPSVVAEPAKTVILDTVGVKLGKAIGRKTTDTPSIGRSTACLGVRT